MQRLRSPHTSSLLHTDGCALASDSTQLYSYRTSHLTCKHSSSLLSNICRDWQKPASMQTLFLVCHLNLVSTRICNTAALPQDAYLLEMWQVKTKTLECILQLASIVVAAASNHGLLCSQDMSRVGCKDSAQHMDFLSPCIQCVVSLCLVLDVTLCRILFVPNHLQSHERVCVRPTSSQQDLGEEDLCKLLPAGKAGRLCPRTKTTDASTHPCRQGSQHRNEIPVWHGGTMECMWCYDSRACDTMTHMQVVL